MRKRICVIIDHMEQGGVSSSVVNFCKHATMLGYEVDFLDMSATSSAFSPSVKILSLKGLSRYWNLTARTYKRQPLYKQILLFPLAMMKFATNRYGIWLKLILGNLNNEKYDCVFAYNQCAPCYYFALNCVRARKKIAVIHGDINFMGDISTWSPLLSYFDQIACVSKSVSMGFVKKFPKLSSKFCSLYNMFDIASIQQMSQASPPFLFDKSKINIISISRHDNQYKGVHRIPEICASLLASSITDFHWYVVGGGPDFEANCKYSDDLDVSSFLTFCGPLDNPFPLLSQSDFLVLTSYTEAYSMALKEAHVLNIPTIAAYYPGIEEAIQDKVNGLIAEQSIESLTEKIADMILNRDNIRSSLSDNLKRSQFSNDLAYTQLKNIIEQD